MQPTFLSTQPTFLSTQPTFPQYAANLPQYAANLPSVCSQPSSTVRELTLPSSLLPAPAPQSRGGASTGALGRSAVTHPTPPLPASPHRVDGSRLAGVPTSSTPPANMTLNVAPTWAATHAGSSNNSPSIFDFMWLYNICVSTGHAANVSVCHSTGYQDVTLFCQFPTPTTTVIARKRCCRHQRCPSTTIATGPPPSVIAPTASDQPSNEPPLPILPPAKRTRKRRCEAKLLRDGHAALFRRIIAIADAVAHMAAIQAAAAVLT